jgi:hypothetical protein
MKVDILGMLEEIRKEFGDYCSVQVEMTQHNDGETNFTVKLYSAAQEPYWTNQYHSFEEAMEDLRKGKKSKIVVKSKYVEL